MPVLIYIILQWLPRKWTYQICYLMYRWLIMMYFLFWLAVTISHAVESLQFKYLIFLTHWGFLAWNSYLLLSTITVTLAFLQDKWRSSNPQATRFGWEESEVGCCGAIASSKSDTVVDSDYGDCFKLEAKDSNAVGSVDGMDSWNELNCGKEEMDVANSDAARSSKTELESGYCRESHAKETSLRTVHKAQWVFFLIGGEYAVIITVLYWVLFTDHDCGHEQNLYSVDSLHLHMINGIFAVVELWISEIPVRLYHAVYSIAFGCVYVLFTAAYYAAGGKDPQGNRFIYPFLDYESRPMAAVCLAVSCAVLFVGAVHFIFFLQYIVRKHITNWIQCPKRQQQCMKGKGSSLI